VFRYYEFGVIAPNMEIFTADTNFTSKELILRRNPSHIEMWQRVAMDIFVIYDWEVSSTNTYMQQVDSILE